VSTNRTWPNGALARHATLLGTEQGPRICQYPVSIYINADGSWFAAHLHGGRHAGLKHPVRPEEVNFTDEEARP